MISTLADLQAALAVGGDVVCDPTAVIDTTGADVTVSQPGTVLTGANLVTSSGPGLTVAASNATVRDCSVAGPGGATLDTSQKLIYVLGSQAAPLSGVTIDHCRLSGSMSDSVWLEWCVDSAVHSCMISDFLDSGVMVISGDHVSVADNAIRDGHLATGAVDVYGIAVTDLDNTEAARSRYCTVTGNRVHQIDWEGIDTHGGLGITITGNVITGTRRSIALVTGNSTRVTAPELCTVSGNTIDATGSRVTPDIGIFLGGISGSPASATIVGNTIAGYDGSGQQPIVTNFWQRADTTIAGNSRPHVLDSPITLSGGWTANASFPPTFTVDGDTVELNGGGAIPPAGGIAGNPVIGKLANAAAWPPKRRFFAVTKGSNAAAGIGVLNVDVDGTLRVDYGSTSDTFTYWLTGSYQAV